MSKEHALQSSIVVDYTNKFPQNRLSLWSTRNISLSNIDSAQMKAIGMREGCPDLFYFAKNRLIGIELKIVGATHELYRIKMQYDFCLNIQNEGGAAFFCTSLDGFWAILWGALHSDVYTLSEVKDIIDNCKTKNLKWPAKNRHP